MTNTTVYPLTYDNLVDSLKGRNERKLAHNTYIRRDTDLDTGEIYLDVRYHGNKIATIFSNKITLNPCGWFTPTTQERLCWFTSLHHMNISQVNFVWYLYQQGDWNNPLGIVNGPFTIHQDGTVTGLDPISNGEIRKRMIKRIKQFARSYIKDLAAGNIESPGPGDCFYCHLDFPNTFDHLESHMDESYFVPSLIVNAIDYHDISILAKSAIGRVWQGETLHDFEVSILLDQGFTSLWKYMLHVYDLDLNGRKS